MRAVPAEPRQSKPRRGAKKGACVLCGVWTDAPDVLVCAAHAAQVRARVCVRACVRACVF